MQITSLPATTNLSANDVLAVEVNSVTYKITASTLASMLQAISGTLSVPNGGTGIPTNPSMLVNLGSATAAGVFQESPRPGVTGQLSLANGGLGKDFSAATNAGFHNSIFRGKNLGASFTSAQSSAITSGTFNDLFVGDYWVINGVNWRIADFDPYYRCGDASPLGHHIAVVPDSPLYTAMWNDTDDISTGYVGSTIRTNIKAASDTAAGAEQKVIAAFGSTHVLNYRAMYPTTYTNGVATSWAWADACVELMNEVEVYGSNVFAGMPGYETGISKRQFSLFRLSSQFVNIRTTYWLRTVRPNGGISNVSLYGLANFYRASSAALGVRPFALIA